MFPQMDRSQNARIIRICALIAIIFVGVSYFHWKDMSEDLPAFNELQVVDAKSMRSDLRPDAKPRHSQTVEFFAEDGLRYQVPSLEPETLSLINQAVREESPLLLRYGRWKAAIKSDKIFTVYQLEAGDKVLMPYSLMAEGKRREQASRVPVLVASALMTTLAVFIALRKNFPRK